MNLRFVKNHASCCFYNCSLIGKFVTFFLLWIILRWSFEKATGCKLYSLLRFSQQKELGSKPECPKMCAYKLVTVKFKWWGLQTKVENFIHEVGHIFTQLAWLGSYIETKNSQVHMLSGWPVQGDHCYIYHLFPWQRAVFLFIFFISFLQMFNYYKQAVIANSMS